MFGVSSLGELRIDVVLSTSRDAILPSPLGTWQNELSGNRGFCGAVGT